MFFIWLKRHPTHCVYIILYNIIHMYIYNIVVTLSFRFFVSKFNFFKGTQYLIFFLVSFRFYHHIFLLLSPPAYRNSVGTYAALRKPFVGMRVFALTVWSWWLIERRFTHQRHNSLTLHAHIYLPTYLHTLQRWRRSTIRGRSLLLACDNCICCHTCVNWAQPLLECLRCTCLVSFN